MVFVCVRVSKIISFCYFRFDEMQSSNTIQNQSKPNTALSFCISAHNYKIEIGRGFSPDAKAKLQHVGINKIIAKSREKTPNIWYVLHLEFEFVYTTTTIA